MLVSWSPNCSAVSVLPLCFRATCSPGAVCPAPACFRVEVLGDCLQGDASWVAPLPQDLTATVDRPYSYTVVAVAAPPRLSAGLVVPTPIRYRGDKRLVLMSDPGLPSYASTGAAQESSDAANVSIALSWTPRVGQEGLVFSVCFRAFSTFKPGLCAPIGPSCIRIRVLVPDESVVAQVTTPGPSFANGTVANGAEVPIAAGCLSTLVFNVTFGPNGAYLEPTPGVGIPPGASLSLERTWNVFDSAGRVAGGYQIYSFSWRPAREFLRHAAYPSCVRLYDGLEPNRSVGDGLPGPFQDLFCAQRGQSLQAAAAYWHGADWIQLWGANPTVKDPDNLDENQLLALGPLYQVKRGDTLTRLSVRFGLSLRQLTALNPDVAEGLLLPGQKLCIMPSVCL